MNNFLISINISQKRVSCVQISRIFKQLKYSYKIVKRRSVIIDFERQLNWWRNPPFGPIGVAGVLGVPTERLIDTDEMNISLLKCNPKRGHSLRGQPAFARLHVSILF